MRRLFGFILIFTLHAGAFANPDSVYVQFVGDTVKIWNVGAYENCCIRVVTTTSISNDTIIVLEHDTATGYCRCLCTFDFSASLTGLLSGTYHVFVYRQYTLFTPESLYFIGSTSFTYSGSGAGTLKSSAYQSACYDPIVRVKDEQENVPVYSRLEQNYPNPFNPRTDFQFTIANCQLTILKVYNILGREIATLINEVKQPGEHTVTWDASNVPSGVYFYRLTAGHYIKTKKLLLAK